MTTALTPDQSLTQATTILGRYGYNSYASLATDRYNRAERSRQVVVLGEVKRGKSHLTNALLGVRGLVPVGVNVCTSAPIRINTHAGPVEDTGVLLHVGDSPRKVPLTELADWVAFDGDVVQENVDELPSYVSFDVGDSPLPNLTLVDTPGVGGLDEGAIRLALREASNAGVLVLAVDSSTTITAPEMEVLNRVKNEGGEVIVAVTKIDKNLRRWRDIVAENRRLIKEHSGRDVPVVGVSSLRALDAVAMRDADPERAARVEKTSGILDLREEIVRALSLGDRLPKIAGLQAADEGLGKVLERIDADLASVSGDAGAVMADLEERRARLKELREHGQEWEHYLQRNLTMGRSAVMQAFDDDLAALQERWDEDVAKHGVKVLRTRPQVFTSQIESELSGLMETSVGAIMELLRTETMRLFDDETVWSDVAKFAVESIAPPEVTSKAIGKRTDGIFDPSMVTMGIIGAGLLSAIIPVAPLAGAVWVGVNMGFRAMKTGRSNLKSWLRETSATTRQTTNRMTDAIIAAVRPELILRYRAHLRDELEDVSSQIEQVRQVARTDEEKRVETRKRLEKNRRIVAASRAALASNVTALRSEAA